MAKKVINIIIYILFWGIPLFLLKKLFTFIGLNQLTVFILPAYIICLLLSFSYKKWWSFEAFKTKKTSFIVLAKTVSLFFILTYANSIYCRSKLLYEHFSATSRGWRGKANQQDDTLGFKPVPNGRAFQTFPVGDEIHVANNKNGFRIPVSDTLTANKDTTTDLLFLGCSYTYGDACRAEESFAYLTAKEANMTYANAGVCSYGLSHMLLMAQRLIPKYKPKYVIVQHSPWLIERGTSVLAPIYFGSLPNPYFTEEGNSIDVSLPLYKTQLFDLDADKIKAESKISFILKTGILFYLKEDLLWLRSSFQLLIGSKKDATKNLEKAEIYAYSKIVELAKKNNCKVIILELYNKDRSPDFKKYISQPGVSFANADFFLNEYLKSSGSKNFQKEFEVWRVVGKDTIHVDKHPNPTAHKLISKSIIETINKN